MHTHKIKRITHRNGEKIYFCVLNCKFKINPKEALGKRVVCWRCGNDFIMNEYSLRLAKPHCTKCHAFESAQTKQDSRDQDPADKLRDRLDRAARIGNVAILEPDDKEDDLL